MLQRRALNAAARMNVKESKSGAEFPLAQRFWCEHSYGNCSSSSSTSTCQNNVLLQSKVQLLDCTCYGPMGGNICSAGSCHITWFASKMVFCIHLAC
jgi:hypothetical protein